MFSYQGSFLLFFSSDSFYILSKSFLFVKNFFNFFQSYLVAFQQQAYLYYHKLFRLSRIFSILFLCRFSRISLNSLSFSFSLVKNFFILFRHFSVVFQLVKIPFLNSVLNKRRRRDLNPRAATNDLLPFQGSPFGQLGYFSKSGEGGIRTHAPFRTNGFQDRLVMTTSIPLKIPNCRFQQTIKLYRICDVDYSIIVLYEMSTLFYYFFRYFFIFLQFIKNMYYLPKKASAITRSSGVVILIFSYFPVKTCTS